MNVKSIKYALLIGAVIIVGIIFYGWVTANAEKEYALQIMELMTAQSRMELNVNLSYVWEQNISLSDNLETSERCEGIKVVSTYTLKNYYRAISLNVPHSNILQYKHEIVRSYLDDTYKGYRAMYGVCLSSSEDFRSTLLRESRIYMDRSNDVFYSLLIPLMSEWKLKYPEETKSIRDKYFN
ncbi:MAG: hypothetical protein ABIF85_06235 [Nanoarchaeota archaeon]